MAAVLFHRFLPPFLPVLGVRARHFPGGSGLHQVCNTTARTSPQSRRCTHTPPAPRTPTTYSLSSMQCLTPSLPTACVSVAFVEPTAVHGPAWQIYDYLVAVKQWLTREASRFQNNRECSTVHYSNSARLIKVVKLFIIYHN